MKNLKIFLAVIGVLMGILTVATLITFAFSPLLAEAHAQHPDREAFYSLDWRAVQDIVPKQLQEQDESFMRDTTSVAEEWSVMTQLAFSMLPVIFSVGLARLLFT